VVVGGETDILSPAALDEIGRVCAERSLKLDFVPRLFGLGPVEPARAAAPPAVEPAAGSGVPTYFRVKRVVDFAVALLLIVALLPLWIVVMSLAFLDVGSPILFWQQRIGRNGSTFLLHKVRTLRPPFDWDGRPVPEEERLSWIGRVLRQTRLDELPQLLNVLVGDMSLIGPRPLLPRDQPNAPRARLSVRPGITGWAQVNGGALLSPGEKDALDAFYIRNASPRLDLHILALTMVSLIRGDRRSEAALMRAGAAPAGGDGMRPSEPSLRGAIADRRPPMVRPL
jgi:lipopolysaccharide/colanic/teichoic acid biosynthesis glycosyltransferase